MPFGQSVLPLGILIEIAAHVRNLFICKESIYPNIAHSGNKERTNERRKREREGRREERDLSLSTKQMPIKRGRVG